MPGEARPGDTYSLFTLLSAPPQGELSAQPTEGATTAVSSLGRRLRRRVANLLQTCDPRGLPGPRPRARFAEVRSKSEE